MLRIGFIYGAIAGLIAIGVMCLSFVLSPGDHGAGSMTFGYLVMLVALSLIFVGVKRHRDVKLGGVIKFGPAFALGLIISFVAGVFYALGWEVYLALTDYSFMENYAAAAIEAKRAAGASAEVLAKVTEEMAKMTESYKNPLFRLPMTFIEIFPVGFIVSLASAILLRNPKLLPARVV